MKQQQYSDLTMFTLALLFSLQNLSQLIPLLLLLLLLPILCEYLPFPERKQFVSARLSKFVWPNQTLS